MELEICLFIDRNEPLLWEWGTRREAVGIKESLWQDANEPEVHGELSEKLKWQRLHGNAAKSRMQNATWLWHTQVRGCGAPITGSLRVQIRKHLLLRPQHQSKLQSSLLCWPQPSASCHHVFSVLFSLISHIHTSLNILLSFLQKSSSYPHYSGDSAFLLE